MKTLYKWSVEDYHLIIESGVLEDKSVNNEMRSHLVFSNTINMSKSSLIFVGNDFFWGITF